MQSLPVGNPRPGRRGLVKGHPVHQQLDRTLIAARRRRRPGHAFKRNGQDWHQSFCLPMRRARNRIGGE
jgi:hypothetical protein